MEGYPLDGRVVWWYEVRNKNETEMTERTRIDPLCKTRKKKKSTPIPLLSFSVCDEDPLNSKLSANLSERAP